MKKLSLILALLIMTVSLVGCGNQVSNNDIHNNKSEGTKETVKKEQKYLDVISEDQLEAIYPDEEIRGYAKDFLGQTVPNMEIRDLEGNVFDLESLRGKDFVMEFIGTWCPACKATSPHIDEFKRLHPDKEVFVIAFADTKEDILAYKEENGLTQPIYMTNLSEDEFKELYQLKYVPAFFFVDKEGTIQFLYIGDLTTDFLEDMYYGSFGAEVTDETTNESANE